MKNLFELAKEQMLTDKWNEGIRLGYDPGEAFEHAWAGKPFREFRRKYIHARLKFCEEKLKVYVYPDITDIREILSEIQKIMENTAI